jgi:small-conductance mechanosensitive channel
VTNNAASVSWFTKLLIATGSVEFSIIILIVGAILTAIVAHWLTFRILLQLTERKGPGRLVVTRVKALTRFAVVLLSLSVILPAADFDPSISEPLRRFFSIGTAVLLGWSALVAIDVAATWLVRKHRVDVDDNLTARRVHTQVRILKRTAMVVVLLMTAGAVLLAFPGVQAYGVSLFASAGAAGLVLGFAARPVLANLIAGIQIALTQPIRIDDVVIVEGEWGWIEEITTTYVVVRIWDLRRLIVPLSLFIEKPFQNWTRETSEIIGAVTWHLDYRAPVGEMRTKLDEFLKASPRWDGKVSNLQVVDSGAATITVRATIAGPTATSPLSTA